MVRRKGFITEDRLDSLRIRGDDESIMLFILSFMLLVGDVFVIGVLVVRRKRVSKGSTAENVVVEHVSTCRRLT